MQGGREGGEKGGMGPYLERMCNVRFHLAVWNNQTRISHCAC